MLKKINSIYYTNKILFITLLGLSLFFIFIGVYNLGSDEKGIVTKNDQEQGWQNYTNKTYGFSIDFPKNWVLYENFDTHTPVINIYKQDLGIGKPPFDFYSDVNQISIFPKGLETEELVGETIDSKIDFDFEVDKKIDYVLGDETVWATLLNPNFNLESWKEWGFIWISSKINNKKNVCIRNGAEISFEECNPYGGDIFRTYGAVDQNIRNIQIEILKTFKTL